jgi:hypothetical protein
MDDCMTRRMARRWEAAILLLLPLAALFYFSFRIDAALNAALPNVLLGDRADVETSILLYLPEVALEPAFDELLHVARYPHPLIGERKTDWGDRLARQIAAVQQAQGLDPEILSGVPRSLDDLYELKTSSLDEFGKAIDIALLGGLSGPRDTTFCGAGTSSEACVVRELFVRAYGERAAREAM